MTIMLNTANMSAASASGQSARPAQAGADAPAASAAALQAGQAGQPAAAGAGATAATAAAAQAVPQPFAQWLDQQAAGAAPAAAPASDAGLPTTPVQGGAAAATPAPAAADDSTADAAPAQDGALLAAMAMPLMPLSPAQVAQAVQAAQGNGAQPGAAKARTGADATAPAPALTASAPGQDASGLATAALAQPAPAGLVPQAQAQAQQAVQAARQPGQRDGDFGAARVAAQAAGGDPAGQDEHADGNAAAAAAQPATPQLGAAMAALPPAVLPAADTVKLAGPPTAWRQSLQEALGERLQVQVGNNAEQAVIRLEPPELGRIDIAIRHSAGSLEVTISASNGDVLRQLQTVSDSLRNDLSQRQFTDVAVTVSPTPKHGAAPFGDPQQQGRGRQQGREQDEYEPGRALAEPGNPASAFSLGGRDRA